MKAILSFLFAFFLILTINASNISISISGFTYSPSTVLATIGDEITIEASSTHPLVQVDEATWTANGNTPQADGWNVKTSSYTFSPSAPGIIYFVCQAHSSVGMKGKIVVQAATVLKDESTDILNISLFPNPVQTFGLLRLNVPEESRISATVLNILGVPVKVVVPTTPLQGENEYSFDVADLPTGTYVMVVTDDRKKHYQKFLVVK